MLKQLNYVTLNRAYRSPNYPSLPCPLPRGWEGNILDALGEDVGGWEYTSFLIFREEWNVSPKTWRKILDYIQAELQAMPNIEYGAVWERVRISDVREDLQSVLSRLGGDVQPTRIASLVEDYLHVAKLISEAQRQSDLVRTLKGLLEVDHATETIPDPLEGN